MPKSFQTLKNKMSPKAQKAADKLAKKLLTTMPLYELRRSKNINQEHLAKTLTTKQANISRMERRNDMHISTLRNYIEAIGGNLKIIAKFPEGEIHINQFQNIKKCKSTANRKNRFNE